MDHKIKRHSDHVSITSEDDGWCVSVTNNGFQFWSIGTIFPTERGALMVATAIELALKDTAPRPVAADVESVERMRRELG